jgi:hypothetical protein
MRDQMMLTNGLRVFMKGRTKVYQLILNGKVIEVELEKGQVPWLPGLYTTSQVITSAPKIPTNSYAERFDDNESPPRCGGLFPILYKVRITELGSQLILLSRG